MADSESLPLAPSELLASLEDHDDVVSWINDVVSIDDVSGSAGLIQGTGLQELDRQITQLVATLELASEDTSSQVERIIDDISRGASRLSYDLHFMREGALTLQALVHNVESNSKTSLEAETDAALDRLLYLDTVKRNMEAAREVLREAESWSTLESDVTSLLGEQNYERAAERLSEANKSMVVFQNTPEYESRRTLMISLQNQLEASLSSALVAAVNSQDVVVCRNYFSIFRNIQRESEFRNYYYGSRKASLLEMWQSTHLVDSDSGAGDTKSSLQFTKFLPTFYASFLAMLTTERSSIPAIFPDPQPTLAVLITSTLSSLQPTLPERLTALFSHYGPKALPHLIAAYKATEEFACGAEKALEKIGYSVQPPSNATESETSTSSRTLRRRSSARMSISRRHRASISGNPLVAFTVAGLDWDQNLFEPFSDFQSEYGAYEQRYLTDNLQDIISVEARPMLDRARLLRERSVDVFSAADEAIARCMSLTHGYGSLGLVQALDDFISSFANKSKANISTSRLGTVGFAVTSASGDLSDLDYTPEDWSNIQSLLHTLEAVRALHERMASFEGKLRTSLVQISNQFRLARADPFSMHFSGTTRGAIQLLNQSVLNSAELQELLDRVDPDIHAQSRSDPFLTPTPPAIEPRRSSQIFHLHPKQPLLTKAAETISNYAHACQVALQDTILSPLRKQLAVYPSLPVWSAQKETKKRSGTGGNALSEVSVPTFSLSATEPMQRLVEGLLNLPRLFEVYANDDALSFSIETLPFINADMLKELVEPIPDTSSPGRAHSRRASSLSLKTPPVVTRSLVPELSPEAVSAAWLSSLGLSLLTHLTSEVLPSIRTLNSNGAAQLASDLGTLSSIAMTLSIEDPELERWREYVRMDDTTGRQKAREESKDDAVLATVARLRGWPIA